MSKKMLSLLLVALLIMSAAGCSSGSSTPAANSTSGTAAAAPEPVKILAAGAISGANAESGRQDMNAVEAAAKWVNSRGGIKSLGGAQVKVIKVDVTSDAANAQMAMERAIREKGILGIVGPTESPSLKPCLPLYEELKIPAMAACNGNQGIADSGYQFLFQMAPKGVSYSETQISFLKHIAELLGMPLSDMKVGILYVNNTWGTDVATSSEELCKAAGIPVVVSESYPMTITDATPLVTKLMNADVNVLFPASQALDCKLIIQTMKAMNYSPFIVGSGSGFIYPTLLEDLGDDANGVFSAGAWNWDSANNQTNETFFKEILPWYESEYKEFMPEQTGIAFAETMVLLEAIEKTGSRDTVAIRDTIRTMNAENSEWFRIASPGTGGFDGNNYKEAHATLIQWQDNRPRTIFPEDIAANKILDPKTMQPFDKQFSKFK